MRPVPPRLLEAIRDAPVISRGTPVAVSSLTGAVEISASYYFSCARLAGGTVQCWGINNYNQLGDGTTTTRLTLVAVTGLGGAVEMGSGRMHNCARLTDGTVRCWGWNSAAGMIGDGTTTTALTPVAVSGLTNSVDLATGFDHSCARVADGTVHCWGANFSGQLGDGTTTGRLTPVTVVW